MHTCDLCDGPVDYELCQEHMDAMRFLDTYSTEDGNYPQKGEMVLWATPGGEVHIGGCGDIPGDLWWAEGDTEAESISPVLWCNLPDLDTMYEMGMMKNE